MIQVTQIRQVAFFSSFYFSISVQKFLYYILLITLFYLYNQEESLLVNNNPYVTMSVFYTQQEISSYVVCKAFLQSLHKLL